jgi:hypothetical protein
MNYRSGDPASLPDLAEIRGWASHHGPSGIVGRTCSSYDCPLAHALEALRGGAWDIDGKRIVSYYRNKTFVAPQVYVRLQAKVDALDGTAYPGIWLHRPIPANQFVNLIDEVLLEEGERLPT